LLKDGQLSRICFIKAVLETNKILDRRHSTNRETNIFQT